MNRIPILAGGAVLASLILCGGAVTMANALSSTPVSQILPIAGVSTSASATPAASASPTPSSTPTPTAEPTATASATADPDTGSGVTVVPPSDPTKIGSKAVDGKGCAHLAKGGTTVPSASPTAYPGAAYPGGTYPYPGGTYPGGTYPPVWTGSPVTQDPDRSWSPQNSGGSTGSNPYSGTGGVGRPGGGSGG